VLELTAREMVAILNQITKEEIIEYGTKISIAGGDGEQYVNKNLALMKARESADTENEPSSEEIEELLIQEGLIKRCPI